MVGPTPLPRSKAVPPPPPHACPSGRTRQGCAGPGAQTGRKQRPTRLRVVTADGCPRFRPLFSPRLLASLPCEVHVDARQTPLAFQVKTHTASGSSESHGRHLPRTPLPDPPPEPPHPSPKPRPPSPEPRPHLPSPPLPISRAPPPASRAPHHPSSALPQKGPDLRPRPRASSTRPWVSPGTAGSSHVSDAL